MNQIVSITRFGRLLRKYLIDSRGQLLANLGLLIGALFVLGVIIYQSSPVEVNNIRSILFFVLGWPCWYIFTVQQTTVLNQREKAINYLMLPASQLEKVTLVWLVSGVGFVVIYVSLFCVLDKIGVSFVNNRHWTPEQLAMINRQGGLLKINPFFDGKNLRDVPTELWVYTALLHPFSMAFSLLLRRYTVPLVVVVAFTLIIIGWMGNNSLLHNLTGSGTIRSATPFAEAIVESPLNQYAYRKVKLPQPMSNQLRYVLGSLVIVLLYITAYVRLKEREV
ncbi:hypothetical protein EXU85_18295 [Spirosoma sp. KCTC 42546]|uniref:hypothetical protein n=1 Tax=Spirosoma sp. KCTC 42546 TaxID=2520506 RepID=UPI0011581975|nr:hypothetical protein [Spirosoma sp. KCTC 42546]QDK80449.1 hypothetical protein EXU85_18295 [Spirosoma sp. KCTC 42546]